jgi:hypothetical protein
MALTATAIAGKILGTVAKPAWEHLETKQKVIALRQDLDLGGDFPKPTFASVFGFALLEYAETANAAAVALFKDRAVQSLFRTAFSDNDLTSLKKQLARFVRQYKEGDALRASGGDVLVELERFYALMCKWADRSRTPAEARAAQQLQRVEDKVDHLQAALAGTAQSDWALERELRSWFKALGHAFESDEEREKNAFQWIINVRSHRGYARILVRGVRGEVRPADVQTTREAVRHKRAQEAWIVTDRRISKQAQEDAKAAKNIHCYTLDSLIEEGVNWEPYLDWLEKEVLRLRLPELYVPIGCAKADGHGRTQPVMRSQYGEAEGYTEGYLDRWLADPAKEHISILGEFGTGKTWVALHYAWVLLCRYREAQQRGTARPRIPVLVSLRDFARVVDVETLFSDFFFRKHELQLPSYAAFEQLNRMGKLLVIFDGFDEMAARIDHQKMIDHFWQMAKTVVPGSKVILTCRTEHFPDAIQGRQLLNAELLASTAKLTGEPPQFEVLELEKLSKDQIRQMLEKRGASPDAIGRILGQESLADLATRPVMADLLIEALPEIEANRAIDMARIYLYAIKRKVERDIKDERTFTSTADKFYFLTELCWEMWTTDQLSVNYRQIPDRIRRLFGTLVNQQKELDHWHYDMMGQTLLVRNDDGDYSPAHRSFVEFFVAYKIAAGLGLLADEFIEPLRTNRRTDHQRPPRDYTWSSFFHDCYQDGASAKKPDPLEKFCVEDAEHLETLLDTKILTPVTVNLIKYMIQTDNAKECLLPLIAGGLLRLPQTDFLGGNCLQVLCSIDPDALIGCKLPQSKLLATRLSNMDLSGLDLSDSSLNTVSLDNVWAVRANFSGVTFLGFNDFGFILPLSRVHLENGLLVYFLNSDNQVAYALSDIEDSPDGSNTEHDMRLLANNAYSSNGERKGYYCFSHGEFIWFYESTDMAHDVSYDNTSGIIAILCLSPVKFHFIDSEHGIPTAADEHHAVYNWKDANFAGATGLTQMQKDYLRARGAINLD